MLGEHTTLLVPWESLFRWMSSCANCWTTLSGGICQWCQEELYIFTEQNEYLPDYLSEEFSSKVEQQREDVKNGINE
jgi:hypothetical protein